MISNVVPTFRREDFLAQLFGAVASRISTVVEPVELFLVDNSPDASARSVLASAPDFVRYAHEPQTGFARARNRGIAEAHGACIIFLDDDETPDTGWLAAFAEAAARGVPAAFGSIELEFLEPPATHLRGPLDRVFSRRLPAASGHSIWHLPACLGSGNAMFRREVLTLESPTFDPAFDGGARTSGCFESWSMATESC